MRMAMSISAMPLAPKAEPIVKPSPNCPIAHSRISSAELSSRRRLKWLIASGCQVSNESVSCTKAITVCSSIFRPIHSHDDGLFAVPAQR